MQLATNRAKSVLLEGNPIPIMEVLACPEGIVELLLLSSQVTRVHQKLHFGHPLSETLLCPNVLID